MGFPGGSDGKESACNAGSQVPSLGWEDPLEKEMATFQDSCLDRGAGRAIVHGVAKSLTGLSD